MPVLSDDDLVTALSGRAMLPERPDAVVIQGMVAALLAIDELVNDDGEYASSPGAVDVSVLCNQALHLVGLDTPAQRDKARNGA